MANKHLMPQSTEDSRSSTALQEFMERVRDRLMPEHGYMESHEAYLLQCPAGACGDEPNFILDRHDGSGRCNCGRTGASSYSPEQLAEELGIEPYGVYGLVTGCEPATAPGVAPATAEMGLQVLRPDSSDAEKSAKRLLEDPRILTKLINLAQGSGIAGEVDLLKTLYLIVTSRLVKNHRLHAHLSEEAAGGKSKLAGFILQLMPDSVKLDLGGGATKRALQYFDDLSRKIIFIDEADNLDPELQAMLRKAVTEANVSRLVTKGDPASGFESKLYTVVTDGMVLIQAGTQVVATPADETRFLMLSPDTSPEQTNRILDAQAQQASGQRTAHNVDLEVWKKAQELLRPCEVIIPYAPQLRQLLTWDSLRARRDFPRLLSLIAAHSCLHQFQRQPSEIDAELTVVAEFEDYQGVYDAAATLFSQATKGLTTTKSDIIQQIIQNKGVGGFFTTDEAGQFTGRKYTTIRGHLQELEALGILESSFNRGNRLWQILTTVPPGNALPTPELLASALQLQTLQSHVAHSYGEPEDFTGSDPVTNLQMPQTDDVVVF